MNVRLTLRLNEQSIERAKKYATSRKVSLSKLIENYLNSITLEDKTNERDISPFVKSIASGKSVPRNFDEKERKEDYIGHLVNKYK